jgi:hypothetical protein
MEAASRDAGSKANAFWLEANPSGANKNGRFAPEGWKNANSFIDERLVPFPAMKMRRQSLGLSSIFFAGREGADINYCKVEAVWQANPDDRCL